jgi:hypothetical protein
MGEVVEFGMVWIRGCGPIVWTGLEASGSYQWNCHLTWEVREVVIWLCCYRLLLHFDRVGSLEYGVDTAESGLGLTVAIKRGEA